MPLITVLLPMYNCDPYFLEAAASLRAQTSTDFRVLILHDGATDEAQAQLRTLNDARFEFHHHDPKLGLIESLNRGLDLAKTEFIARMDADDISLPSRFTEQLGYLRAHPEVGVLGTRIQYLDDKSVLNLPLEHRAITEHFLFEGSALAHPSVMMRASLFKDGIRYRRENQFAEDFGLWVELAGVTRLANLAQPLLQYRRHPAQTSTVHVEAVQRRARLISSRLLQSLQPSFSQDEAATIEATFLRELKTSDQVTTFIGLSEQIEITNLRRKAYDPARLRRFLAQLALSNIRRLPLPTRHKILLIVRHARLWRSMVGWIFAD